MKPSKGTPNAIAGLEQARNSTSGSSVVAMSPSAAEKVVTIQLDENRIAPMNTAVNTFDHRIACIAAASAQAPMQKVIMDMPEWPDDELRDVTAQR